MIEQNQIEAIRDSVRLSGLSETTVAQMREQYPDLHFTYCQDDDIADALSPVMEDETFNIYLVDGRDHCLRLTGDLAVATGLVLAEVEPED